MKTDMIWTFAAFLCQITGTIMAQNLATYCKSAWALNFNEDEY